MEDKKAPIIVKKINKGGHGHHGGAWKVAMADFAIAMMAFFMVMWLLGGTSVEQKAAISSYFKNPSLTEGMSHVAAQGQRGPGGASTSMIKLGGTMELPKGDGQKPMEKSTNKNGDPNVSSRRNNRSAISVQRRQIQIREAKQFNAVAGQIQSGFNKKSLKKYKNQLYIDISDKGLRIQIVDKANRPMFSSGSSYLQPYTRKILGEIAASISKLSSKISITGHTDATPFKSRVDYTNWELSADRANAARRELIYAGVKADKIARVVGLSSTILFDKNNPKSSLNRRISIIVLNQAAMESLETESKSNSRWSAKRQNNSLTNTAKPDAPIINSKPNLRNSARGLLQKNGPQSIIHRSYRIGPDKANRSEKSNSKSELKQKNKKEEPKKKKFHLPKFQLPPIIDPSLLPNQ